VGMSLHFDVISHWCRRDR